MSFNSNEGGAEQNGKSSFVNKKKFKGIRRRKWGKWVSEIRVPGTSSRLWLGSYSTAEAAAAAHDVASFYLRSTSPNSSSMEFNFPEIVKNTGVRDGVSLSLSPRSVQKAASDAGMAVDAARRVFVPRSETGGGENGGNGVKESCGKEWSFGDGSSTMGLSNGGNNKAEDLNISVDDYL